MKKRNARSRGNFFESETFFFLLALFRTLCYVQEAANGQTSSACLHHKTMDEVAQWNTKNKVTLEWERKARSFLKLNTFLKVSLTSTVACKTLQNTQAQE